MVQSHTGKGGQLLAALAALFFAVLSGYRLATIWHELPTHMRDGGPDWMASPGSPLHGVFRSLAAICLSWIGGAVILFADAIRPDDSSATHPCYLLTVVGAVVLLLGVSLVVTILRWGWPSQLVPHPYRRQRN